jgi:methylenetetrahydrofolate dehydrogenase (NADP+)/methenyltetrahydrofolate cyclohydrolase
VLRELIADKDVDGVTTASLGRLFANEEGYVSCTALGALTLLDRYAIPVEGKRAVVLGRSLIIGKPIAAMLINRNATVTVCHSRTKNLPDVVREADIVVAAIGKPEYVKGDWLKPGCVVVDVGYNRVEGRQGDVGDVDFAEAEKVSSYITPVPGGCGPMTIAMLLLNTLAAAKKRAARKTAQTVPT